MKSLDQIRIPERNRKYKKLQDELAAYYEVNGKQIVAEMKNDAIYLPSALQGVDERAAIERNQAYEAKYGDALRWAASTPCRPMNLQP